MSSDSKKFHYKCAHDMRVENPLHIRLVQMWDAVRDETQGRLEMEMLPWGSGGPSKECLDKLLDGRIEFHPISGMPLSIIVPVAAMEGLPFAYESEEEACRVLDGPLGDYLRREIAATGLKVFLRNWPQGFNQITSSKGPIRNVDDLQGFKLRTAQVPYKKDLFSSLGCDTQPIFYQAVFDNLKNGTAWGQETPYLYVEMDKFVEVQTHLSITNHRLGSFWLCANSEAWKALPPDIQASIERNAEKYVKLFRKDMVKENAAAAERLKSRLIFNQADTATFIARLKQSGFYGRRRKEYGETAWKLLEEGLGRPYPM